MIHFEKFECNMFQENCYVVSDDTRECVIIDCGALYEEERMAIVDYITKGNLLPKHLVSTHGHIDHNFGNNMIAETFGIKPEVFYADELLMNNLPMQAESFLGMRYDENIPAVGKYFDEKYEINFGNHSLQVIHTPGHTPGSVMLFCENERIVFSGDTLFRMSIGRTDFQFGSYSDIIASLKNVINHLPEDTVVLPGHGEKTTIAFEATNNPYIR